MAKRSAAMFDYNRAKIRRGSQYAVGKHAHANSRGHATRKRAVRRAQQRSCTPARATTPIPRTVKPT